MSIGEIDSEVEVGQEYVARALDPISPQWYLAGRFEDVDALMHTEPEILIGHGSLGQIAKMNADAFAAELRKRMKRGNAYRLVLYACQVGKPVTPADSLARQTVRLLETEGYNLAINAPMDLVFTIGPGVAITGNPYRTQIPKEAAAKSKSAGLYYKALLDVVEQIQDVLRGPVPWATAADLVDDADKVLASSGGLKLPPDLKSKVQGNKVQRKKWPTDILGASSHLSQLLGLIPPLYKTKSDDAIAGRLELIMSLSAYKLIPSTDRLDYAELKRILENRFRRQFLDPTSQAAAEQGTAPGEVLHGLPTDTSRGWETSRTHTMQ